MSRELGIPPREAPWGSTLHGTVEFGVIDSELLRGNYLGDPWRRPVCVYLPPSYGDNSDRRYPVVFVIQGYTGHVAMWLNRTPFRTPFLEAADGLFAGGGAPECIVVLVDAWTAYGGSQFVDSPGTGRYHSYLCDEVVPWVDRTYRTLAQRESRAIAGKSSGGFGAMITPMLRPDLFSALATHAGDTLYEYCYLPDFARATRYLREYDGDIHAFWADFQSRPAWTKPGDESLISVLGCSAAFSADDDGRPVIPFDPSSGRLIPDVWERWLAWDPVRMVDVHRDAVRSLEAVWIDAGTRDEYFLDLGATAFRAELDRVGVADHHVHFELFDAGHGSIDYRYPKSLAWLASRLHGQQR